MFKIEFADFPEIEKAIREMIALDFDDEYHENFEIRLTNKIQDILFENQIYGFAVSLFWNNQPLGFIGLDKE